MISVDEARIIIEKNAHRLPLLKIKLIDAVGCVLGKDVYSPVNLPPFDQSAMDGYAVVHSDFADNKPIRVVGEVAAGAVFNRKILSGQAVRIFTGAPLPKGADTVVVQENANIVNGCLVINGDLPVKGSNVRTIGSQVKKAEIALPAGHVITAGGAGYLAAMGISSVKVITKPRISIIVSGSELRMPGTRIKKAQVYESNSFALSAAAQSLGLKVQNIFLVKDEENALFSVLVKAIKNSDLVLVTGGISVGDYDYTGRALDRARVKKLFYKVAQKPGKPLYFGKAGRTLVFGLPGNPGAVLSCFYEYVYRAVRFMSGHDTARQNEKLQLTADCIKKKGISVFLKGKATDNTVSPLDGQESYMLKSFAAANCLIYLPAESECAVAGDRVEVIRLPGLCE